VEELKSRTADGSMEAGYHRIFSARFIKGDSNEIEIDYSDRDESRGTIEYRRTPDGRWQVLNQRKGLYQTRRKGLEIAVSQQWDKAPVLAASIGQTSRVIWDPNPQFKNFELGEVRLYKWKDMESRNWTGGRYLPGG